MSSNMLKNLFYSTHVSGAYSWLYSPIRQLREIGNDFFEEITKNNELYIDLKSNNTGLMENFLHLNSPAFDATRIHPKIIDFYEKTSCYEFDVWSEWVTFAKPFARLLSIFFTKRLQQLNLPISSMDLTHGMTSEIVSIKNASDQSGQYTGWLRKIKKTGDVLFAGAYTSCIPPNLDCKCVKAIFPLPNGNMTVVLRPENIGDGSLKLHASGNRCGNSGLFLLVNHGSKSVYVKYVKAIKQTLHVYLDEREELRTDHIFKFWGFKFLQLHYRIRLKYES